MPRRKRNINPLSANTMVLPEYSSMRTVKHLTRLKYLTDQMACWMREWGYLEVCVELYGTSVDPPKEYRLNLKSDLD